MRVVDESDDTNATSNALDIGVGARTRWGELGKILGGCMAFDMADNLDVG